MQFYVDHVEFDFDDSCPYCGGDCYNDHDHACDGFLGDIDGLVQQEADDREQMIDNSIGMWDADDEDDLIEEITCASGWCVKSIDYRIISYK